MAEKKEEKIVVSIPEWSIVLDNNTFSPTLETNNGSDPNKKEFTKLMEVLKQKKVVPMWNKIFLLFSVIAVSLDPLFFYIPMIDQDKKCIKMDKKLAKSALILRSLMDIVYIIDITCNVAKAYEEVKREKPANWVSWKRGQMVKNALAVAQRLSWSLIFVDFLAILPVAQVTILVFHKGFAASGSWIKKWLNAALIFQYLPRIFRIYLSCMELTRTQDEVTRILWVKGALNFFLYILSSHVFGGFWYFYTFQRETACWHQACNNDTAEKFCDPRGTYMCYEEPVKLRIEHLKLECPKNPSNGKAAGNGTEPFDFGIFQGAIKSGIMGSYDFPEKLFNCFWWGLRNLSSLGQNLETSTYLWENCLAISISIIGLLLFLYLIGNLQTYMQLATTKSEEIGEKLKLKERDIELWIERNGLPKELKTTIMQKVKYKLEENKDVDVENLLSILPSEDRKFIKRLLCLPMLRKVPIFQSMDDQLLEMICENLKPVIYTESSYMIREGDPLDRMLFITQGTAWAYTNNHSSHNNHNNNNNHNSDHSSDSDDSLTTSSRTTSSISSRSTRRLKKCDYFGEELLEWSMTHNTILDFPISTTNVKSHTKVEGFALMANDLMNAVRKNWWLFRRNIPTNSADSQAIEQHWETSALSAIQKFRGGNKKKKTTNSSAPQLAKDGAKSQSSKYQRLRR